MKNHWIATRSQPSQDGSMPSPDSLTVGGSLVLLLFGIGLTWLWLCRRNPQISLSHRDFIPQVLQWLSDAKALEYSKQYEGAITIYDQALNYYPQDYRLWHERGLAFAKLQQFEAAIASYDCAYKLRPNQRDLAHERGDALMELERYEEAILIFDVYLRYDPYSHHVLTDRGYALYQLGRYEEALRSLKHFITSDKRDRDSSQRASNYRILCLQALGQLETALQEAQQAIKRYPEDDWFKTEYETLLPQIAVKSTGTVDDL